MRTSRFTRALLAVAPAAALLLGTLAISPALAQERIYERKLNEDPLSLQPPSSEITVTNPALDAAFGIANLLDTASSGLSGEAYREAIITAAEAGQPQALWELSQMYETGAGVERDAAKAFELLERLVDADDRVLARSLEAVFVAKGFIRLGEIYHKGLTEIDVVEDQRHAQAMLLHAATRFGDAEAQYRIGKLYLDDAFFSTNPLQAARWMTLSARKGHVVAQATLGSLLFHGVNGSKRPVEGLVWLAHARSRVTGAVDTILVIELHETALLEATPEQRLQAEERVRLSSENQLAAN